MSILTFVSTTLIITQFSSIFQFINSNFFCSEEKVERKEDFCLFSACWIVLGFDWQLSVQRKDTALRTTLGGGDILAGPEIFKRRFEGLNLILRLRLELSQCQGSGVRGQSQRGYLGWSGLEFKVRSYIMKILKVRGRRLYAFVSLSACLLQTETQNAHCTITVRTFWLGLKDEIRSHVQLGADQGTGGDLGPWDSWQRWKLMCVILFPLGWSADTLTQCMSWVCHVTQATRTCRHARSRCSCLGLLCRAAMMEHLPAVWLVWADSEVKAFWSLQSSGNTLSKELIRTL